MPAPLSHLIKLILTLFFIGLFTEMSMAHTKVTNTVPANEAVLKKSPQEIKLTFPEALKITALKLLDSEGTELTLEHQKTLTPIKEKIAIPPTLGAGTYRVIWRGISADGHPIKGQISFSITPE